MKRLFFIALAGFFSLFVNAFAIDKNVWTVEENGTITGVELDSPPSYPGGIRALYQFLIDNMEYPSYAEKNHIEGLVKVLFTINKKGDVENVRVEKSVHPVLDEEAIRVVKLLRGFTPGYLNGQPVNVSYTLPITFKLPEEED